MSIEINRVERNFIVSGELNTHAHYYYYYKSTVLKLSMLKVF